MLIRLIKIIYFVLSILCFGFLSLLSLVGGHGHFNQLTLKSFLILFSGIYLMFYANKKNKINILLMMIVFLIAIYSFVSVIIDFINTGNPRNFLQVKIFNVLLYLGLISVIALFIKKIADLIGSVVKKVID